MFMDIPETLKIMRALANRVNPSTGNTIQGDSTGRQPQLIKALHRAIGPIVQEEKREQRKPTNRFRSWTRAEDAQVCEELRSGKDFHESAKAHHRAVASILARLVKPGKSAAMAPRAA